MDIWLSLQSEQRDWVSIFQTIPFYSLLPPSSFFFISLSFHVFLSSPVFSIFCLFDTQNTGCVCLQSFSPSLIQWSIEGVSDTRRMLSREVLMNRHSFGKQEKKFSFYLLMNWDMILFERFHHERHSFCQTIFTTNLLIECWFCHKNLSVLIQDTMSCVIHILAKNIKCMSFNNNKRRYSCSWWPNIKKSLTGLSRWCVQETWTEHKSVSFEICLCKQSANFLCTKYEAN